MISEKFSAAPTMVVPPTDILYILLINWNHIISPVKREGRGQLDLKYIFADKKSFLTCQKKSILGGVLSLNPPTLRHRFLMFNSGT